ncbi:hypothetical protein JZ751_020426 [Albula glossodonta]|uniref:Uncharacterized protein n=1 Tax=Albula glossodonta TaxID=121402 RepID=A0A8T2MY93_9TELE|nr:hypothetical protein JZ751_020426 [Albula glossodonta]
MGTAISRREGVSRGGAISRREGVSRGGAISGREGEMTSNLEKLLKLGNFISHDQNALSQHQHSLWQRCCHKSQYQQSTRQRQVQPPTSPLCAKARRAAARANPTLQYARLSVRSLTTDRLQALIARGRGGVCGCSCAKKLTLPEQQSRGFSYAAVIRALAGSVSIRERATRRGPASGVANKETGPAPTTYNWSRLLERRYRIGGGAVPLTGDQGCVRAEANSPTAVPAERAVSGRQEDVIVMGTVLVAGAGSDEHHLAAEVVPLRAAKVDLSGQRVLGPAAPAVCTHATEPRPVQTHTAAA